MVQVQWLKVYTDIFDNEKMKKLLRNRDGDDEACHAVSEREETNSAGV